MGRPNGGWTIRKPKGRDVYFVRFTHVGRQHEYSTGTGDRGQAEKEAARIYAEIVSGRAVERPISADLEALITAFLLEYEKDHAEGTAETVTMYARAHWIPFFRDVKHITKKSAEDYARARLTKATRSTVRKELSGLRKFAAWAGLDVDVPGLPKHGYPGRRHKSARKERATILTPAEVERLLDAMPDRSERKQIPVRSFFRVMWETGLRPSTIFRLEVGKHYTRGAHELHISKDIDKAYDGRTVTVSEEARRALERCLPDVGRIFPTFSLVTQLHAAVAKLTSSERGAKVNAKLLDASVYDVKHSRITAWANMPGVSLPGVSYLVGHQSLTTTARYVQGQRAAADAIVLGAIVGAKGRQRDPAGEPRSRKPAKTSGAKEGT